MSTRASRHCISEHLEKYSSRKECINKRHAKSVCLGYEQMAEELNWTGT